MFIVSLCIGVLLLAVEAFATWKNRRLAQRATSAKRWCLFYRWRYVGGAILAVASVFMGYPMYVDAERYWVVGVPFFVAAFDSSGTDFVGPFTVPLLVANAVVWLLFPNLLLWCWAVMKKVGVAQGA